MMSQKETIDEEVLNLNKITEELQSAHVLKKKTLALLPDADQNMAKIEVRGSNQC